MIEEYKEVIMLFKNEIFRVLSISFISLSSVYIFGRMFDLIKNYRTKNFIAFISIFSLNYFYSYSLLKITDITLLFWDIILYSSFSIILYVLIGFKLYDRCDDFLDKRFGKDKPLRKK